MDVDKDARTVSAVREYADSCYDEEACASRGELFGILRYAQNDRVDKGPGYYFRRCGESTIIDLSKILLERGSNSDFGLNLGCRLLRQTLRPQILKGIGQIEETDHQQRQ